MPAMPKRWLFLGTIVFVLITALYKSQSWRENLQLSGPYHSSTGQPRSTKWTRYKQRYPVSSFKRLPTGKPRKIPTIQYAFGNETPEERQIREERQRAVKESFAHGWKGYRERAWGKDEVTPLTGMYRTTFGGWAATLVDSLDTLWMMGFEAEFDEAVGAVAQIDFTTPQSDIINVFETTIRYLGGLLAAYDLSGRDILLEKAVDLGDMLYVAFDTEFRIPVARWNWTNALNGAPQAPEEAIIVAEPTSLSLEFTRLSQLTGNPKYYDAISRITDLFQQQQSRTKFPGLWPLVFYGSRADTTTHNQFSLGAMADSLYEYLPKEYLLLGGAQPQYREMYKSAIKAAKQAMFFRPMTPDNRDILMSGILKRTETGLTLAPEGQHLVCFVGGMVAIGAKIFSLNDDLEIAKKLTYGCIWAYEASQLGIMPEVFSTIPCRGNCEWDEERWKDEIKRTVSGNEELYEEIMREDTLPQGFSSIQDPMYLLRPEAIESVFILYRITGDSTLLDKGWKMFEAIEKHTRTEFAHAALSDVREKVPTQMDKTESFWFAETLKYFYLLFSEPSFMSLDDYVFNTEAHVFKRPSGSTR